MSQAQEYIDFDIILIDDCQECFKGRDLLTNPFRTMILSDERNSTLFAYRGQLSEVLPWARQTVGEYLSGNTDRFLSPSDVQGLNAACPAPVRKQKEAAT